MDRDDRERDLDRELQSHLDLEAEELRQSGLSPDAARYAAQRALGNSALIKETAREAWGWTSLERVRQDLRYAFRGLRQSPAFTAAAVLSLALGIGANTAIFSLLNAILLRLLPVPEPQQIVQVAYTVPGNWNAYFDYPHLERFRAETRTLSGIFGGVSLLRVNVGLHGNSGLGICDAYTDNFFAVLGLTAQQGRLFAPGDDRDGADVAVLSDRYWHTRFASDPAIVGQTITVNQVPFTVIGIAATGFSGLFPGAGRDLWVPLHALDRFTPNPERWREPFASWLTVAGRLAPGVPLERARAEMDVVHRAILAEQLAASEAWATESQRRLVRESHLLLLPASNGVVSGLRERYTFPLKVLLGVAGIVLLISCVNVANLVLARASHRRREIALRMALGSGRVRLVRQLFTESLLLAAAGGVAALAVARWGGAALVRMISTGDTPLALDVRPDWRIFAFTAAVSLGSAILFGLAPAIRGTRLDPGAALKEGARAGGASPRLMDRALIAAQVTLSLVLVSGAGLFARTLDNLHRVDVGYDRDRILMFSTDANFANYPRDRAMAAYRAILEKAGSLPGVQSASVSIVRPVDEVYSLTDVVRSVDGRELPSSDVIHVAWNSMSPGYFATVGTPLLLGRDFEFSDRRPVVLVNEQLARRALPGRNPIGHRLDGAEIVGVVKDSLYEGAHDRPGPVLYRPLFLAEGNYDPGRWVGGGISFELRYRTGTGQMEDVRRAVASVDRNLPVFRVKTLRAQTEDSLLRERLLASISGFFGGLALVLACLGLYGLMAYGVARRTSEIGIRMALGAPRPRIVWLVLKGTLGLVAVGITAGVPLSLWAAGYLKSLFFGVAPADAAVLAVSIAALLGVAVLAAWLPAKRASNVDPMVALRCE
ncbi:MAG TPA: ABC transporter permease [Candidatus Sulfopaludibacter sp.]|nr:ABC transporter permease [Candidatus Sulfopaludibacter sp.]